MTATPTLTDKQAAILAELFGRHYDDDMAFTLTDIISFGFKDSRIFFRLLRMDAISPYPKMTLNTEFEPDQEQQYKLNLDVAPALYKAWYDKHGYKSGGNNALLN